MTLAMVKVLPEPVTPSSTWCGSPSRTPRDEFGDGVFLVTARAVGHGKLEAHSLRVSEWRPAIGTARFGPVRAGC